jgi:hypothetical protein
MPNVRDSGDHVNNFTPHEDSEVEYEQDGEQLFQSVLKTAQLPDKAKRQIGFIGRNSATGPLKSRRSGKAKPSNA